MLTEKQVKRYWTNESWLHRYYGEMCRFICVRCGRSAGGWNDKASGKLNSVYEQWKTEGKNKTIQHHHPYFLEAFRKSKATRKRLSEWRADKDGLAYAMTVSFLCSFVHPVSPSQVAFLLGCQKAFTQDQGRVLHERAAERAEILSRPFVKSLAGRLDTSVSPWEHASRILLKADITPEEIEGKRPLAEAFLDMQYPAIRKVLSRRDDCWVRHSREYSWEKCYRLPPYDDTDEFPQKGRHFVPIPFLEDVDRGRLYDSFAVRHTGVPFGACIVHRMGQPLATDPGDGSVNVDSEYHNDLIWFPQPVISLTDLKRNGGEIRMDFSRDHVAVNLTKPLPWSEWIHLTNGCDDLDKVGKFTYSLKGGVVGFENANRVVDLADRLSLLFRLMGNLSLDD